MFFDDLEVPAENLIGEEGKGFRYILDGMNAERILIAPSASATATGSSTSARLRARARGLRPPHRPESGRAVSHRARLRQRRGRRPDALQSRGLFDRDEPCGAEANMAKLLAADASWEAANVCLQTHGGFGFAAEYDVERKFRETRLYQVAPISTNLILAYIARARARPPALLLSTGRCAATAASEPEVPP